MRARLWNVLVIWPSGLCHMLQASAFVGQGSGNLGSSTGQSALATGVTPRSPVTTLATSGCRPSRARSFDKCSEFRPNSFLTISPFGCAQTWLRTFFLRQAI
eukprot:TRINITY_DN7534_c0_g3_i1.p1 TRINITY_DN7534_c0_g3~~TRINITY_DN7534_c0_g3_i1.p1  ORF type:complete len:102 (+),score=0.83 TRINITY_DN7534_c0_g3_i1:183-488(+)